MFNIISFNDNLVFLLPTLGDVRFVFHLGVAYLFLLLGFFPWVIHFRDNMFIASFTLDKELGLGPSLVKVRLSPYELWMLYWLSVL